MRKPDSAFFLETGNQTFQKRIKQKGMKKLLIAQILLFFFLSGNAQEKSDAKRNYTLKLPLSSLVGDIYGESMGIGIGIEKKIKTSISVSQEIGYIFHVDQSNKMSEDLRNINGLKFTTEIRKYFNKREVPESGFFANVELKNILTKSAQESWTIENILAENDITRYRGLLSTNLGMLFYWDKNKKSKITMELLGGGGLGYLNAHSSVDSETLGIKSDYNSGKGFYPWLNLDLKIGYILR